MFFLEVVERGRQQCQSHVNFQIHLVFSVSPVSLW